MKVATKRKRLRIVNYQCNKCGDTFNSIDEAKNHKCPIQ